jgi:uncharacterized protein YigE (DUF2233 family)
MKVLLFLALLCGLSRAEVAEEPVTFAEANFRVVKVAPQQVQLAWKDGDGNLYRTFDKVQAACSAQGKRVKFIMNAGIFEPEGIPSGLLVEDGKQRRAVNLAQGGGNFFLKPNGVISFGSGVFEKPMVRDSYCMQGMLEKVRDKKAQGKVAWAVQSGPVLLLKGKRHPSFREGSPNKKHRNGVGIDRDGKLVFAMTDKDQLVNFWDFAGLFLSLGCKDALFLDGDISMMAVNPDAPVESNRFGAMFVVAE